MTEPLTQKVNGIWLVLPYGQPVSDGKGFSASYETVQSWSREEQEAFGLFRPESAPAAPDDKVETGRAFNDQGGKPIWTVTYADAPPIPPAPPFTLFKADIWRRCTNDEATKLDTALSQQPVRLRRMFNDATLLRSDDELFSTIQSAVTQLLGDSRATDILAPSVAQ